MRIAKRISFSLDGFWPQWCCGRHALRRSDSISPRVVKVPGFQQWNAVVRESSKICQHYFEKISLQGAAHLPNRFVYALFDRVRHSVGERAQRYRSLITSD